MRDTWDRGWMQAGPGPASAGSAEESIAAATAGTGSCPSTPCWKRQAVGNTEATVPSARSWVLRRFQAHGLRVRARPSCEEAWVPVRTWIPHLWVLDYLTEPGVMCYETFVTYGAAGSLPIGKTSLWRSIPGTIGPCRRSGRREDRLRPRPGYMIPRPTRAVRFLAQPYPVHRVQVAAALLPRLGPGLAID